MLPRSVANLLRIAGLLVSAILISLPWFLTTDSADPFLFQGWSILSAASICACIFSAVMLFFRPRQGQIPFISSFFLLSAALTISTLNSNFQTSLRTALIFVSLLLMSGFLRLCRRQIDNASVAGMIVLSGTFMAAYSFLQYFGLDIVSWDSDYAIVGTLSNPNFFGTFMCVTAVFSLAFALDPAWRRTNTRTVLLLMFVLQFASLLLENRAGTVLSFCVGLILLFTRGWEVRPGRIMRASPFVSGILLAFVLIAFHGLLFYASTSYPWETLQKPPAPYFPIISRLILWQMGFSVFLNHPLTGLGPGTLPYVMPVQRPSMGSALGIKIFNDDPHSGIISLLAESGVLGLIAFCSLLAVIYGTFVWFRFKNFADSEETPAENEQNIISFPHEPKWSLTLVLLAVVIFVVYLKLVPAKYIFLLIPLLIAVFGFHNAFIREDVSSKRPTLLNLPKATVTALLVFFFNSLYNTNYSVLPVLGLATAIFSLHFSGCQRDVVWKRHFSFLSLVLVLFPVAFVFTGYKIFSVYHIEQTSLYLGEHHLTNQNYSEGQKAFEMAITANPQSLKAHYGLAVALEKQNRLEESQDLLRRLDSMVPNAFNSNFELARILLERKQILEAHKFALKSLEWDQLPRSYELLGRILAMEGRNSEAEKVFNEGLLLVPYNTYEMQAADRIRLHLAALASNRGDFETCEKHLKEIRTSVKEDLDALYLMGMLLSRQNRHQEALKLFEQALEQSPRLPRLMNAVGYTLIELDKDLERSLELLESAHRIIRDLPDPPLSDLLMIAHSLGKLYWKTGKLREAGELLELAYTQSPDDWVNLKKERLADFQQFSSQLIEVEKKNEKPAEQIQPDTGSSTNDIQ